MNLSDLFPLLTLRARTLERYEAALQKIAKRSGDDRARMTARRALDPEQHEQDEEHKRAESRVIREKKREILNSIGAGARWYYRDSERGGVWVRPLPKGIDREDLVWVESVEIVGTLFSDLTTRHWAPRTKHTVNIWNLHSEHRMKMLGGPPG